MCHASMSCLLLFMHRMPCALVLDFANAGRSMLARIAMMAMTTSNSISVNAEPRDDHDVAGLPLSVF